MLLGGVLMNNGDIIPAKNVVSAAGVENYISNVGSEKQVPKMYKTILAKIPPSLPALLPFVNLDGTPESLNLPSDAVGYPTDSETGKTDFNKLIGMMTDPQIPILRFQPLGILLEKI